MAQILHQISVPATDAADANFKGRRGELKHRCGRCLRPASKLARCMGCHAVRYCSREHQMEHRQEHKSVCNKIKKSRTRLDKEDHAIRYATPDFMIPANAFETEVGHFWGIPCTRDYMRARFDLADKVRRLGTLDGAVEALDHMRDMIRLCRSDNLGVRDIIPPLMLQLDQDQECYDFIKWYDTVNQRSDYDWGDVDLPYLDVKGADVLEDVRYLNQGYGNVQHMTVVLLLKLKLLIDIINIALTRKVIATRLPSELWRHVEIHVVRSPISRKWVGKPFRSVTDLQQKLQIHVKLLARFVQNINDHFLHVLLNADEYLSSPPESYERGSFEEMHLFLHHSYPSWWQHEGVLELLRSAKSIARRDSEDEIEDMMTTKTFKTSPGSKRSKEELLDDVSRNRLWGYFDDAVEDAVSLGEQRPSEIKMSEARADWQAAEEEERMLWWESDDEDEYESDSN